MTSTRKKITRTRTGCYTCRRRRIKCDETKPICGRCTKSSRECSYPSSCVPKPDLNKATQEASKSIQETALDDVSETSDSDNESTVVKWSSSSSSSGSTISGSRSVFSISDLPEHGGTEFDFIDGYFFPEQLRRVGTPGLNQFENSADPSHVHGSVGVLYVPRPPMPIADDKIPFFLAFHQMKINSGHYYRHNDYHQFCTKGIRAMARQSRPLEYALAAFSALVYSVHVNRRAKSFAFIYYAEALRGVQDLLNRLVIGLDDTPFPAIAAVLQLASFERFVAETAKCFRHVQGAAQILLHFSTPVRQCSTALGRSLLEWYCHLEGNCCLLLASKCLLQKTWRRENIRVRRELASIELPHLSQDERKARLLDDLWQETWVIVPHLADVLATIPELKVLKGPKLLEVELQLKMDMIYIQNSLKELTKSSRTSEILKITEIDIAYQTRHSQCCPSLPFSPCSIEFPSAGLLRLSFLSLHNYLQLILYTPLRDAGLRIESLEEESDTVELYAFEICRTFAAIEDAFGEDLSILLPCFNYLSIAGFSCPPKLRIWLWHKLAHFEELGSQYVAPIKKNLSVVWGMPELLTTGFGLLGPLQDQKKILSADDIELAAKIVAISLEDSDEESGVEIA